MMDLNTFDGITKKILQSVSNCMKAPGNLKEYSPWMSEFKLEYLRNELEIPGKLYFLNLHIAQWSNFGRKPSCLKARGC